MHKPVLSPFLAFAVLCSFCINRGSAESRNTTRPTLSSHDLSVVLALLDSPAGTTFKTTTTEHFVIVHEPEADGIVATGMALEFSYLHFYDVFAKAGFSLSRSEGRLVWICFPGQDGFNKYALRAEGMDLSWLDGYYSTLTNRVAVVQPNLPVTGQEPVNPPRTDDVRIALSTDKQSDKVLPMAPAGLRLDMTRLTHELAHQLAFNSGIQKRGVMYPVWVSEGLATNFESDALANTGALSSNAPRAGCLATAYSAGEMVPLRQLIVQTRVPADSQASRDYYAQAWAFFRFLLTEHPAGLRAYLHRVSVLPVGRRDADTMLSEFIDVFGVPESLDRAWKTFVIRQVESATTDQTTSASPTETHAAQRP